MATFDELVQELIEAEGRDALTNDPNDAGGLTKYGISQKAFPSLDIAALTEKKAIALYKKHYWDKFKLEDFPEEARRDVFFNVVNSGTGGIIGLQKELGVATDGKVGPKTIAALKKYKGDIPTAIKRGQIKRYVDIIKNNDSQREYANGWMNRALGVDAFSGRGEDIRSLPLDKMQATALAKLDEVSGVSDADFAGNATPAQHHRPAPVREPSTSLPAEFPEQFIAMMGELVKASQNVQQTPSQADTEGVPATDTAQEEGTQWTEQEKEFIERATNRPSSEEPEETSSESEIEWTEEEREFISRATGVTETEEPVFAEVTGESDASKDPTYGIF